MKRTLSTAVASIGAISGLLGIVGGLIGNNYQHDVSIVSMSALLIIVSMTFFYDVYLATKRWRSMIIDSIAISAFHVRHASPSHLKAIAKLQRDFYPNDAIPEDLYAEWYKTNPDGFFVIEKISADTHERELVGHITFLSLKKQRFSLYMDGEILETEIRGNDILPPNRREEMAHIYIESLIVTKKYRERAIPELIKSLPAMIDYFSGDAPIGQVCAMAATGDGEKLLLSFDFVVVKPPRRVSRRDNHQMYSCDFQKFLTNVTDRRTHFDSLEFQRRIGTLRAVELNVQQSLPTTPTASASLQQQGG